LKAEVPLPPENIIIFCEVLKNQSTPHPKEGQLMMLGELADLRCGVLCAELAPTGEGF